MSYLKFFILSVVALHYIIVLNNYVQAGRIKRILGVDVAVHSKVPYTVFIYRKYSSNGTETFQACGGSILDDYHVISAAHCFIDDDSPYQWTSGSYLVLAGADDLLSDDRAGWVTASVKKVFIPKLFVHSLQDNDTIAEGDIAVLMLETSLNLKNNTHLKAVSLPKDENFLKINETAIVSGYGNSQIEYVLNVETGDEERKTSMNGKLYYANAVVLGNLGCQKKNDEFTKLNSFLPLKISEKHICAQIEQKRDAESAGICEGDSGGPLVYEDNILIGVVNMEGYECKEDQIPANYARVSSYIDFIEKARKNYVDADMLVANPPIMPESFFI